MRHIKLRMQNFFANQAGAVTVDMIVLMAAVVGLGLAAVGTVSSGLTNKSNAISAEMTSLNSVVSGNGSWFDRFGTTGANGVKLTALQIAKNNAKAALAKLKSAKALVSEARAAVLAAKAALKSASGSGKSAAKAKLALAQKSFKSAKSSLKTARKANKSAKSALTTAKHAAKIAKNDSKKNDSKKSDKKSSDNKKSEKKNSNSDG